MRLWLEGPIDGARLSHALMALTDGELSLGLTRLHAIAMGYLGATMFAMTTRMSNGYSGRPVAADSIAWSLYWILQATVLLRVIAGIWSAADTPFTLLAIMACSKPVAVSLIFSLFARTLFRH